MGSSIALLGTYPEEMQFVYGINKWSFIGYCIAGGMFVVLLYTILRRRIYK
jgi:hypothetical protein